MRDKVAKAYVACRVVPWSVIAVRHGFERKQAPGTQMQWRLGVGIARLLGSIQLYYVAVRASLFSFQKLELSTQECVSNLSLTSYYDSIICKI